MKKILFSFVLLLSVLPCAQSQTREPIKTEAMLILMSAASAQEPEVAAAVNVLALLLVPTSNEYQTDMQRGIAYAGLGALAFYNYDAEEDGRSKEDIFWTNLVVFNIVLAGELFGSSDTENKFNESEKPGGSFNFQLSPSGTTEVTWQYRF